METNKTMIGKSKTPYNNFFFSSEICENEKFFYRFSPQTTELRKMYLRII